MIAVDVVLPFHQASLKNCVECGKQSKDAAFFFKAETIGGACCVYESHHHHCHQHRGYFNDVAPGALLLHKVSLPPVSTGTSMMLHRMTVVQFE